MNPTVKLTTMAVAIAIMDALHSTLANVRIIIEPIAVPMSSGRKKAITLNCPQSFVEQNA